MADRPTVVRSLGIVAGLLAVAVAGCVSMPGAGPPVKFSTQQGTGQNQVFLVPHAEPPSPGWGPQDIVRGFMEASARYATDETTARAYLTSQASQSWQPGSEAATVLSNNPHYDLTADKGQQAHVTVGGTALVNLTNTGSVAAKQAAQSAQQGGQVQYTFTLVKEAGQWRIDVPPKVLVLTQAFFIRAYQTQDVYYLPENAIGNGTAPLVPDTVYVPLGATVDELLARLVGTIRQDPGDPWLQSAVGTSFPAGTTVRSVKVVPPSTVVVDLGGAAAHASKQTLNQMAAQLAWTLSGAPTGQGSVTGVEMDINNVPSVTGTSPPKQFKDYSGFDPYPQAAAPFTYVDPGTESAQSRCGSVQPVPGQAMAVFGGDGAHVASCSSGLGGAVPSQSASGSPGRHGPGHVANPLAMVLPSPDGAFIATVSADKGTVSIWPRGGHHPSSTAAVSGVVLSMSWDQMHQLWIVTQGGYIQLMPAAGKPQQTAQISGLTSLSIAPDGVRVALVEGGHLELAAISQSGQESQTGRGGRPFWGILPGVQVGTQLSSVQAVTWYDRDNLMVVLDSGANAQIEEVPVNGGVVTATSAPQRASFISTAEAFPVSIAAGSADNLLIAGLSNGELAVATSLTATWQILGQGTAPAYGGASQSTAASANP